VAGGGLFDTELLQQLLAPLAGQSRSGDDFRELVVGSTEEEEAGLLLLDAAPLLEEEGNFRLLALIANGADPLRLNWARTRSALSSDDDPRNPPQVDRAEKLEEWLDGEEGVGDPRLA